MNKLIRTGLFVLGSCIMFLSGYSQPQKKTNIIFIMADDLGYGDLGCYGQDMINTPNIDKLALDGMKFTQAYAGSTVCAPSRCSLITGMNNGNNRVRDNLPHDIFLRPDDFTIAELLKQAGYITNGIGKWGLGNPGSWGVPLYQGFDHWYGHLNQDQAHFYYPDYLWDDDELVLLQQVEIKNGIGELKGNRGGEKRFYTHDLFTGKAIEYINENQNKPFFLYLAYTVPHYSDYPKNSPDHFQVPDDYPYTDKPWPQSAKNYAAMITRMDSDIGKIVELINAKGLDENTLIVFTSDNGPYKGVSIPIDFFNSNGPLRGGKRDLYEGGIRIPFIARWKGVIPGGIENHVPIAFWDIMPTFAEIIGHPQKLKTDGVSIYPYLVGKNTRTVKRSFYWDYGHVRNEYVQAIRYGKYKGIQYTSNDEQNNQTFELYDLTKDLGEKNNIASGNLDTVEFLKSLMEKSYSYSNQYSRSEKN